MFNKNATNAKRDRSGEGSDGLTADIMSSAITGPGGNIESI